MFTQMPYNNLRYSPRPTLTEEQQQSLNCGSFSTEMEGEISPESLPHQNFLFITDDCNNDVGFLFFVEHSTDEYEIELGLFDPKNAESGFIEFCFSKMNEALSYCDLQPTTLSAVVRQENEYKEKVISQLLKYGFKTIINDNPSMDLILNHLKHAGTSVFEKRFSS